jgi:hypothetical protein
MEERPLPRSGYWTPIRIVFAVLVVAAIVAAVWLLWLG